MIIHNPILTGSFTVNGTDVASITSSAASITAINSYTASQNILNGTYATTGSNTFKNPQTINSNLIVTGSITAQTLVVQTITSSVDFVTGSTRFGSSLSTSTHQFTGSVSITGSLDVITTGTEFQVTSTGVKMGNVSTDTHTITGSVITSGSVGINTTSSIAGVTLNVQGNQGAIVINGPGSNNYTGLRIYNDQVSANRALEIDYAGSAYASALISGGITGESAVIATTGAYPLQFGTGNTFRMCILANGKIGIGTLSPTLALTVQADNTDMISWRSPSYEVGTLGLDSTNAHGAIFLYSSGSRAIQISAKPGATTYFNAGYVGIGTNNPTSPLYIVAQSDSVGGDGFRLGNSAISRIWNTRFATTDLSYNLDFYDGASWTNRLKLHYAGKLQAINSLAGDTTFDIRNTSSTGYGAAIQGGNGSGVYSLKVVNYNDSATYLYVRGDGNVSVGSSSAAYNFNVYAASGADGWGAFFGGAGTTKGGIYLGNAGTQYGTLYFDNANNNVYLKQSYASGNVSVIANTGGVYLANGGTSWTAISSDVRKKKNFETVPGLDAILQVEPVKYHFLTDDNTSTKRLGFKAQNIQPLIPEMVLETGEFAEDGSPYLTVTPDYILPVLVKAIQELQAQITELKNK